MQPLDDSMVLIPTGHCVVRPQKNSYLVYNPSSDEMHLLTPSGYSLYRLCDGFRSVVELEQTIAAKTHHDHAAIRPVLHGFFSALLKRNILEYQK